MRINNLSWEERTRLYNEALRIKKEMGWGRVRIGRALGLSSDRVVNYWLRQGKNPVSHFNFFKKDPSRELSYIIGVIHGDGCVTINNAIRLDAKDKEFVEKFAQCINKIFNKSLEVRNYKKGLYTFQIVSKQLSEFLNVRLFQSSIIERYPEYFIRGLADSEGSPNIGICIEKWGLRFYVKVIVAVSNNLDILTYTQKLLKDKFDIKSNITLNVKGGTIRTSTLGTIKTNKNVYRLTIDNFKDTMEFSKIIGFSIRRKQEKLVDAIEIKAKSLDGKTSIELWKILYKKIDGEWIKIKAY